MAPPLPVSSPSLTTRSTKSNQSRHFHSYQSSITITAEVIQSFFTRLSRHITHALSNRGPWAEFADWSAYSRPTSLSDAASRLRKNLLYFRVNYLVILSSVLAFSLLSHPFSLILLVSLAGAWLFLYFLRPSDQQLVILGRSITEFEALIGLSFVTIVVIFVTSIVSLLAWAVIMGVGIVCGHGACRIPEYSFADNNQETLGSGLFSFYGGSASSSSRVPAGLTVV